jgi:outer membrane cobalamin receptor
MQEVVMRRPAQKLKNLSIGVKTATAVSLALSMPSFSQPAFTSSNSIQEISVTAQKREQDAQSVGITMNVIDAAELRKRNYQNLPEVASAIANIELFEDFPSAGIPTWVIIK